MKTSVIVQKKFVAGFWLYSGIWKAEKKKKRKGVGEEYVPDEVGEGEVKGEEEKEEEEEEVKGREGGGGGGGGRKQQELKICHSISFSTPFLPSLQSSEVSSLLFVNC